LTNKIRALIFDFDGLILDSEGPIYQTWEEIYQSFGQHLPLDLWVTIIGTSEPLFDPLTHLEDLLGYSLEAAFLEAQRRKRQTELIQAQPVMPGVIDYLRTARRLGLKIGLASSSPDAWIYGHLERLGLLADFDCIRTGSMVQPTKPDPALYLSVLAAFGLQGSEAVAREVSAHCIAAAKQAGLYCVAVPHALTQHLDLAQADLRVASLDEMPLEKMLARLGDGKPCGAPPG